MPDIGTKVTDLQVGDLADLCGDRFADPTGENPVFPFEYQEVTSITKETPYCVAVRFESFDTVGFPVWHSLPILRLDPRE